MNLLTVLFSFIEMLLCSLTMVPSPWETWQCSEGDGGLSYCKLGFTYSRISHFKCQFCFLGLHMRLFPAASWQRDLSGEESNRGCSRKGHSNLCSDSQEFTSLMPLQPGKIASKLASPWRSSGLPQCCGNGREEWAQMAGWDETHLSGTCR